MQNLEQIRAAKAQQEAENTSKQAVSKLPAMIMTNGLLAAAAFANETNDRGQPKREKMQAAMNAVAQHLQNHIHGLNVLNNVTDVQSLTRALSSGAASSLDLQRATAEALALLTYIKRYAVKTESED